MKRNANEQIRVLNKMKFNSIRKISHPLIQETKSICLPFQLGLQSNWRVQRGVGSPQPQPFVHMSALLSYACSHDTAGTVILQGE